MSVCTGDVEEDLEENLKSRKRFEIGECALRGEPVASCLVQTVSRMWSPLDSGPPGVCVKAVNTHFEMASRLVGGDDGVA